MLNLGIGLATILFINVMNFVIRGVLKLFTKFERHITTSREVSSIFLKVRLKRLVCSARLAIQARHQPALFFGGIKSTW